MNPEIFTVLLALGAVLASAQEETTTPELPDPTTEELTTTTKNPGQSYGAACNGLVLQCNRYSETVLCVQRRQPPPTEPPATEPPVTGDPLIALFHKRKVEPDQDICETGLGVDLGRCQCRRNCKDGLYVEDGEFDPYREVCVGLVGSSCSLLVPNCTENAHCNYAASTCVCNTGFVDDGNRRCMRRS